MDSLKVRVTKRRHELEDELGKLPPGHHTRRDIEQALGVADDLLTGDLDHMSEVVSVGLTRWLEVNKYLGEHHEAKAPGLPRLSTSAAASPPPSIDDGWGRHRS